VLPTRSAVAVAAVSRPARALAAEDRVLAVGREARLEVERDDGVVVLEELLSAWATPAIPSASPAAVAPDANQMIGFFER